MKTISFALLCILGFLVFCAMPTVAQRRSKQVQQQPTFGRLSVKTSPQSYPVLVNGKAWGMSGIGNPNEVDLPPGTYSVEVLFPNKPWKRDVAINAGKRSCVCLNYSSRPMPKVCPSQVTVSAPEAVTDGDLVTYSATPEYSGTKVLNYIWTVTPANAKITSGQGTQAITVDTTGLPDQNVVAQVEINDGSGDPICRAVNQATTKVNPIPPLEPTRIDVFNTVGRNAFDDVKARLDNFAVELQNRPDAQGYIIAYGKIGARSTEADRNAARSLDYLVKSRGVDSRRLAAANGGFKEQAGFEL
ncbi:MAG: hypothetical protein H7Z37_02640, partial [Pyrinomonadaceae bacterium]|nr:hypothetical protein [Pyrinomonadaceae bacterium]